MARNLIVDIFALFLCVPQVVVVRFIDDCWLLSQHETIANIGGH